MKRLIFTILTVAFLAIPPIVSAQEQTCVTQYGGGVVCGKKTPETPHAPVKAGLGDINFGVVGATLIVASVFFYVKGTKGSFTS